MEIATELYEDSAVSIDIAAAILAFAAEQVAAERARCVKICRDEAMKYAWSELSPSAVRGALGIAIEAIEKETK